MLEREEKLIEKEKILVLGGGVSGLASGILLLENGYDVTIWARELHPNTTSNKAAALWQPFLSGPVDKVPGWGKTTLDRYKKQMNENPNCGVMTMRTVLIFDKATPDPWWKDAVGEIKRLDQGSLPEGYVDGYEIDGFVIDTSRYMPYLMIKFADLGGRIVQRNVEDVNSVLESNNLIVNCTGLGSKSLFNDEELTPVRGQVIKVENNGFPYSLSDDEGPNSLAYIIPRHDDIVLGGTEQMGDSNIEPNQEDTESILRRCAAINPAFKNVSIKEVTVGIRPGRKEIRLEVEEFENGSVIHNYGHGGSGFTLAWGCAEDVLSLVNGIKNKNG